MKPLVVLTDLGEDVSPEARAILHSAGAEIVDAEQANPRDPVTVMRDADALWVFWYPLTKDVIRQLRQCRIILRCGIGVDNIDLQTAAECGIPVCNVPDYCIKEVANHTLSLALALARRLPALEHSLRDGSWKPDIAPIPAFEDTTFAVAGFGRIARAVLARSRGFEFRLAAYDPYVPVEVFEREGVLRLDQEALLAEADILSLHMPLTPETRHFVNAETLRRMKPSAVLVNTSRGSLVDTVALAGALQRGEIAGAGLDVFETEPLPLDHPLRACHNALLTPHYAWHSARSGPKLHRMAAEEIARALRGEPLQSCVNLPQRAVMAASPASLVLDS